MEMILSTTRRPDITFHADGLICISSRASRLLHLTHGASINIAHHNGEYLLTAVNTSGSSVGRHEGRCHPANKGRHYFRANSVRLSRVMLQVCGAAGRDHIALMCGQPLTIEGQPCLPIITRTTL